MNTYEKFKFLLDNSDCFLSYIMELSTRVEVHYSNIKPGFIFIQVPELIDGRAKVHIHKSTHTVVYEESQESIDRLVNQFDINWINEQNDH